MKETVSFRTDSEKLAALDRIAQAQDRDRSYLINQALDNLISLHEWQIEHIKKAVQDLENGEKGIPHEEVFARLEQRMGERYSS